MGLERAWFGWGADLAGVGRRHCGDWEDLGSCVIAVIVIVAFVQDEYRDSSFLTLSHNSPSQAIPMIFLTRM